MNKSKPSLLSFILGLSTIVGILALIYLLVVAGNTGNDNPTQIFIERKLAQENKVYKDLQFDLVDPAKAPESIQELARFGFEAMVNTKKIAPEYVGNDLSCTHCHFAGGDTTGGAQGGFSLAGVATKYPAFDVNFNKVIDLPTRINSCFLKSMNGKALPLDSQLMLAFVTYFQWISKNLPIYATIPWLGIPALSSSHVGNIEQGKQVFDTYCSLCHKEKYIGEIYPPQLWGNGSFNDAAGMSKIPKLASFIYWNMPYSDRTPILTEEQAIDVAAYILSKPRPHYYPSAREK